METEAVKRDAVVIAKELRRHTQAEAGRCAVTKK
jgi:hypothetical protein